MRDPTDPPRQRYVLKPTSYEVVNRKTPEQAPAPVADGGPDPGPVAADPGRIEIRELYARAGVTGMSPRGRPAPGSTAANEVHALLRLNEARAEAAGLNRLEPRPPPGSRRRRDFWISLLGSYAGIGLVVGLVGPNVVSILFGLAGVVLLTCGLTWVFWFVMDRY